MAPAWISHSDDENGTWSLFMVSQVILLLWRTSRIGHVSCESPMEIATPRPTACGLCRPAHCCRWGYTARHCRPCQSRAEACQSRSCQNRDWREIVGCGDAGDRKTGVAGVRECGRLRGIGAADVFARERHASWRKTRHRAGGFPPFGRPFA